MSYLYVKWNSCGLKFARRRCLITACCGSRWLLPERRPATPWAARSGRSGGVASDRATFVTSVLPETVQDRCQARRSLPTSGPFDTNLEMARPDCLLDRCTAELTRLLRSPERNHWPNYGQAGSLLHFDHGSISKCNTSSLVPSDSYSAMAASSTLSAWT
jgi:hypothetical protein